MAMPSATRCRSRRPSFWTRTRIPVLTGAALLAFAANSVLCRAALADGRIDPASFSLLRLVSGAIVLAALSLAGPRPQGRLGGDWRSAALLVAYAVPFAFAYLDLATGTGALLLFGAVQATMVAAGLLSGERLSARKILGFVLAAAGVAVLLSPSLEAPEPWAATAMVVAGAAWGLYSLRGRGSRDPLRETAGNFARGVPLVAVVSLLAIPDARLTASGVVLALASGALASGVGYAIWYTALPHLAAMTAGLVQLAVPVLAAVAGILLLGEEPTARLALSALLVLGGVAAATLAPRGRWRSGPCAGPRGAGALGGGAHEDADRVDGVAGAAEDARDLRASESTGDDRRI